MIGFSIRLDKKSSSLFDVGEHFPSYFNHE